MSFRLPIFSQHVESAARETTRYPYIDAARSFLGQAPLFALALVLCYVVLPDTRSGDGEPAVSKIAALGRVDFFGALTLGLFILALMLPLEIGGQQIPWTHPAIFILFGAGALLGLCFLATDAWWAREPIFPLALLRQRNVVTSYMIMACQIAAQTGVSRRLPSTTASHRYLYILETFYL